MPIALAAKSLVQMSTSQLAQSVIGYGLVSVLFLGGTLGASSAF
jgi:hypothetical protein